MMMLRWILIVCLCLAGWTFYTASASADSHYTYKTRYRTQVYRTYHYCSYRYSTCTWHWHWRLFFSYRHWRCYSGCFGVWRWATRVVSTQYRTCQTGWGGSKCNMPICSPRCGSGGVCVSPTKPCYCKNGLGGDKCDTAVCSYKTDCWPGTCKGSAECYCSSGFEGDNCQQMRDGPIFKQCNAKLIVDNDIREDTVFEEVCGKPGYENSTFYTNSQKFNVISMTWDTFFQLPEDTPVKPRYLYLDVPGVIEVKGNIKLLSADNITKWERPVVCPHPSHATNPFLNVECRDVREPFNEPVKHLYRLEVELSGTSGGFKTVHNEHESKTVNKTYTGTTVTHQLHIYFDLEPPVHCSKDNSCGDDEFFLPIYVSEDITKKQVDVVVSGWQDADTGLDVFQYEVFPMRLNQNQQLEEVEESVASGDWDGEEGKPPVFTPAEPGMYSVILTVSDEAGNRMRARTLLLYDPLHNITTNQDKPLHIKNAHAEANFEWTHNTEGDLEVSWEDHFENKFHHENHLLEVVKAFDTDYDDTSGDRTKDAIPHAKGITAFMLAWTINSNEMDKMPEEWENATLTARNRLEVTRKDGDVIRVWIKASDAMGHEMVEHTTVQVDTTEPYLDSTQSKLVKNVQTKKPRPLFASRVELNVVDRHSGIDDITFEVHEVVDENTTSIIGSGTEKGQKVAQTAEQCAASGQCVCIRNGECFSRFQGVYLNNCWFMDREDKEFVLKFKAYNKARLSAPGEYRIGSLDGIRGQGEYPPIPKDSLKVSPDTLTADAARLEWGHPSACYKVQQSVVSYQQGSTEKEHTVSARSIDLLELQPATEYQVSVLLVYQGGRRSEAQTLTFTTAAMPEAQTGSGGSPIGAIVGGVIGGIVVILLVVLIVIMLLRRRDHRPMVPEAITKAKNRLTTLNLWHHGNESGTDLEAAGATAGAHSMPATLPKAGTMEVAYKNPDFDPDEDDLYIYGGMATDENARWKFAMERIDFGKPVPDAKGRFADFRFATIITKSGQEIIVAKMLKPSASEDDKMLMKAKMNFFGTALSFHPNVVNFIGALPNDLVLLYEYCDKGPLSDWLNNVKEVTEEVENDFNNFAIMIANGMVFLHKKDIVHRRLGVRNILLKTDKFGNKVAKISGFGPMAGEEAGDGAAIKDRVPIKYLAQEQMKKPTSGVRKYTKESDVWTYGIMLWEIYSKGEKPYPGMRSAEVTEKVANTYRMPKPEYCPDFVYGEVMTECWFPKPAARPAMDDIYTSLKHHFDGDGSAGGEDLYYDENEMAELEEEFYDEASTAMKPGAYPNPNYR